MRGIKTDNRSGFKDGRLACLKFHNHNFTDFGDFGDFFFFFFLRQPMNRFSPPKKESPPISQNTNISEQYVGTFIIFQMIILNQKQRNRFLGGGYYVTLQYEFTFQWQRKPCLPAYSPSLFGWRR